MDYVKLAKKLSESSTCLKRHYGAVIVKDNNPISYGYNSVPPEVRRCYKCPRLGVKHNTSYVNCRSVHAEAMAIVNGSNLKGSILYLYGVNTDGSDIPYIRPCPDCTKLIIEAGIVGVVAVSLETTNEYLVSDFIKELNNE